MKQLLFPVILLCQYTLISAEVKITITAKPNGTEVQIKELEKNKEDLLKQINGAIDESVVALKEANDSESAKGIHYLTALKKQIKVIGSEETDIEAGNQTSVSMENMLNAYNITGQMKKFRRKGKHDKQVLDLRSKKKYISFDSFDDKKDKKRQTTDTPEKQIQIKKDIEEWIAKKALEKERIKKYREQARLRAIKKETCPNFGIGKDKKKYGSKKSGSRQKKRHNYPCCRKCCKQSYLGCL